MKTLVLAASLLTAMALPAAVIEQQPTLEGTWRARLQENWTRKDGPRWVSLQLEQDGEGQFGFSIAMDDDKLEGLGARDERWTASGVRFSVRRDAGTVDFQGNFSDGRGTGTWRFAPNAEFVASMRQTYQDLALEQVFRLAIHDVSRSFIASMSQEGYVHPSLEDLTKMRIHGVTVSFIREMRDLGYKDLALDDMVRMRIHGVSGEYVKELKGLGYSNVSVEDLVRMRIHGVTPEFIRDVNAASFKNMSADDLVDFSIHGRRWLKKRA